LTLKEVGWGGGGGGVLGPGGIIVRR